jgi:hypothetical protein
MTACVDGEGAGVVVAGVGAAVLLGDPVGLTAGLTEGDRLDDGDVAVGVGEAEAGGGGLPGEVPVGLGDVDVRDADEHALSRRTAHTDTAGHASGRGRPGRRRSRLLRPSPGIAHLTVHRSRHRRRV